MTTDTKPLAPTDAEIVALADETRTAEGGANGYIPPISFARAVLSKWGTPPAVAGEPIGVVGYTVHGTQYVNWLSKAPAHGTKIYTTPQPTQPQAGAVPLTDEQIEALPLWKRFVGLWPETRREIVRTIEHHHGIKGGQHGTYI